LFPDPGRYPFPLTGLAAVSAFCIVGISLTWHPRAARSLCWIFAFYLVACLLAYAVPSAVGANVARLRYAALPIILLVLALRRWRPLSVSLVVAALVSSWSFAQIGLDVARSAQDTSASPAYWQPAIAFLRRALTPSYRVEAVDTTAHWEAYFLP